MGMDYKKKKKPAFHNLDFPGGKGFRWKYNLSLILRDFSRPLRSPPEIFIFSGAEFSVLNVPPFPLCPGENFRGGGFGDLLWDSLATEASDHGGLVKLR